MLFEIKRNTKGFTLIEVMLWVVLIAIVATASVSGYQGYRDRVAMMVDETNMKILASALKLYAYDGNALPATLSELPSNYMNRAYAMHVDDKQPYTFLAYVREFVEPDSAYALLPGRYFSNNLNVLICPEDDTPPTALNDNVNHSYAVLRAGDNIRDLLAEPDLDILGEVNDDLSDAFRHRGQRVVVNLEGEPSRTRISRAERKAKRKQMRAERRKKRAERRERRRNRR